MFDVRAKRMAVFHVHIGLPKTGSTTFQNMLKRNGSRLSRDLALVNRMCFGEQRKGLLTAHKHIRTGYRSGIDTGRLRQALESACAGPLAGMAEARPVLISDEGLCGPHPGQFKDHEGVLPALPAALDALAAVFPEGQTIFHIVVRETESWMKSLYSQAVKQTGYRDSIEMFRASFPDGFDIEAHVNAVRAAHGDKTIEIHRMEDHSLFPGEQILTACGVDRNTLGTFEIPVKTNQSWSRGMLQAMRVINGADIDEKSRNILRKEIARQREIFDAG